MENSTVIVAHEKHGTEIYRDEHDGTLGGAALVLLLRRFYDLNLYEGDSDVDSDALEKILDEDDGRRAWLFLLSRCDYEYEYVEEKRI